MDINTDMDIDIDIDIYHVIIIIYIHMYIFTLNSYARDTSLASLNWCSSFRS